MELGLLLSFSHDHSYKVWL